MHYLTYVHNLPLTLEAAWDFFSSPENLKTLTPEYLDFQITSQGYEEKMYPGQIISYTVKPMLKIPITWVTEITHVERLHYFIDEQRFGPYKFWHHEHRFSPIPNGVQMVDKIYYTVPFGMLGKALNALYIRRQIEGIFSYRKAKMSALFGTYKHP